MENKSKKKKELPDSTKREMKFGETLKRVLKDKKITQAKLSELTGISTALIYKYCRDKSQPSAFNFLKISDALGIPPDEFYPPYHKELSSDIGSETDTLLGFIHRIEASKYREIEFWKYHCRKLFELLNNEQKEKLSEEGILPPLDGDLLEIKEEVEGDKPKIDKKEFQVKLPVLIGQLPPKEMGIVNLYYYQKVAIDEIARLLRLTENEVITSYKIASEKIKRAFIEGKDIQ